MTDQQEIAVVAQLLVRYLRRHPQACDTPQGIARWWLDDQQHLVLTEVLLALEWMEERGLLQRLQASDGRVRYRRSRGAQFDRAAAELDRAYAKRGTH